MHFRELPSALTVLLAILVLAVSAANPTICPILGQQWPTPKNLAREATFQAVAKNLTATLQGLQNTTGFNTTSYSVVVFSGSEDGLAFEYHHTDRTIRESTSGTKIVTADTVYRLASVSKVMTLYMFLAQVGEGPLSDPVAKWIPELLVPTDADGLDVVRPDWKHMTLGDLAGQLSGLPRDLGSDLSSDPAYTPLVDSLAGALPPLPQQDVPTCGYSLPVPSYELPNGFFPCTVDGYVQNIANYQAIFPNSYTPSYGNDNFELLGIALSRAAENKSLEAIFNDQIVHKLHLHGTSYTVPKSTCNGVIPVNETASGWSTELGLLSPTGGNFASSNDMAKIGRSILRSTVLPPTVTRHWLRPDTFSEFFAQGVGKPWEIFRVKINGASVEIYSKLGDFASYHSFFAVIPNYDIGVSILTVVDPGVAGSTVRDTLPEIVIAHILPAVDEVARSQARRNFAGHYASSELNSSLTIAVDDLPGLKVTSWISNSTDLYQKLFVENIGTDMRLMPNLLYSDEDSRVGFTGSIQTPRVGADPVADGNTEKFLWPCAQWLSLGGFQWGGVELTQLVFETDAKGNATEVRSKALRVTMERQT